MVLLVCGWMSGCGGPPPRVEAPSLSPASAGSQAMTKYDKNNDGKLSQSEMSPALKTAVVDADTDKDGTLSAAEITARVQSYVDSKLASMMKLVEVTLDGKPLSGATVTLIPEEFLGSSLQPASGTTDDAGLVSPGIPNLGGVQPGIYRIEVSKKDGAGKETIPAKYNSNSELGQEVALSSSHRGNIKLELKSK